MMSPQPAQTYKDHARAIMQLGLPLIGSQLAQFAVTLVDTVMLGWYSVEALAAQVLGGGLFILILLVGSGVARAVMPMVATAEAAGDDVQVRRVARMGLWVSIIIGLLTLPIFLYATAVFLLAGQDPHLSAKAGDYLRIAGPAIVPALVVMVLTSFLSALERAQVVLWVTVGSVVVNALVNYALIFGNWGFPEMGLLGAAWASLSVHVASFFALVGYVVVATRDYQLFHRFWRPDWEVFGQVTKLGIPIGLTSMAEAGLFTASAVMMGWLGTQPLAAHGIAMQITACVFMVHIGLSNTATVRAGRAVGRGDQLGLRRGAWVVLGMSMLVAAATMVAYLAAPEFLMGLFLAQDDPQRPAILAIGVGLLAASALFALVDAAQVMALGLLRGLQDTRIPMVMALFSYWVVGVPVSYLMGFPLGWGGVGIWLGMAVGLALAGVMMMVRFWRQVARRP